MAGKIWQAGSKNSIPARASACLVAIAASGTPSRALCAGIDPARYFASIDPNVLWEILIGAVVVCAFLASLAIWIHSALRRVKRSLARRTAYVSSALNSLSHGVVMTDPKMRIVYCNDRYFEIYGLDRSDLKPGMTGPELLALRRSRGALEIDVDDFYRKAAHPEGMITELPNGKQVLSKYFPLSNGGSIATHEDYTEQRKLSRELASTKQFLESVLDNVPVCVAAKSIEDGRYIFANRAFERFSRFSRDRIVGNRADEIFRPLTAAGIAEADHAALQSAEGQHRSEIVVERGEEKRILASNRVIVRNEKNQPEFMIAMFDDITEHRSLSQELENTKKFLELVVDNIPVSLIVERVSDGKYLLANRSAEAILNRKREEATGLTAADIFNPREAKLIISRDEAAIKKRTLLTEEHPISTRDGLRLFLTRRMTVLDEAGRPQYLIKTHEDVTDRRQTESRMAHMAYHDGLTDLPNRAAFLQALTQMIEACGGTGEEFAVLCVDLDGLKEVNDVFGHATGDKLLIEVAHRIQTSARGGVVARLSGDEFGLIIDGTQPDAGKALAQQLSDAMGQEFQIDGKSVRTGITTGISVFPHNGTDGASLLANAGAALFRAKQKSRGTISLYEPEMDQQIRDRRVLHQELSVAIKNGELSLFFQPQAISSDTVAASQVIGFEALARWLHPVRGFVSPADFIPLAEETGLIVQIGEWTLKQACAEASKWPKGLKVAVNLSAAQFRFGNVRHAVISALGASQLVPQRLELEVTESLLLQESEGVAETLEKLHQIGVRFALDDFGTGYSSLSYLSRYHFDKIKIDQIFIKELAERPKSSLAILRSIVALGTSLGIVTCAEGVETEQQFQQVKQEGCTEVQGYYISPPRPASDIPEMLGRGKAPSEHTSRRAG